MTAGEVFDYTGTAALLNDMLNAQRLLGDRRHYAGCFRNALEAKGVQPGTGSPIPRLSAPRRTEIVFVHLKDWHRVPTG